jgi:hypothetical protein
MTSTSFYVKGKTMPVPGNGLCQIKERVKNRIVESQGLSVGTVNGFFIHGGCNGSNIIGKIGTS